MRRSILALLLVALAAASADAHAQRRRAVRHLPPRVVPAPAASADSYSVDQASTLSIAAPGVLANDTLHGATIASFGPATGAEHASLGASVATAQGGTLVLQANGGFTYTPAASFSGTDTFVYVIRNDGGSASASVAIIVRASQQIAASGDTYGTPPDTELSVPPPGVLANDSLAGGRILSFGPVTGSEQATVGATSTTSRGGTITLRADGSFSYGTPEPSDDGYGYTRSFTGLDSFRYVIQNASGTSSAAVNINVDLGSTGADFVVTTPGHYYAISGLTGENPVITLQRGRTYTFQINAAASHPFAILDAP
ncbi:MAG TPA: Ig-like domain-containing protein, partial [Thermoanaerobaculia bacterium]|nr:Ig-like domain-containing protein [Thermoanaerobaculia bacterium]